MSRPVSEGITLLLLATAITASHGAGGLATGVASEVTQLMNNSELAAQVAQQARTVRQLADTHIVTYNQLLEQLRAGLSIGGVSVGDVLKTRRDMEAYQESLKILGADLGGFSQTMDARGIEARLQNLSLQDYVLREQRRVQDGNAQARARLLREIAQSEQIKQDIVTVRDLGSRVENTPGIHAATQLLNSQMNLMLQQMTRLVALTSEAQGSDKAAAAANEATSRAAARSIAEQIISNEQAMKQRQRQMIGNMLPP